MLELTERDKARVINGIPESNLVLYCPGLQGRSATLLDRSVTGANGTITGAAWKHHPSGLYVLSFDGTGDKVVFGTAATYKFLHGAEGTAAFQFTIECLVALPIPEPDTFNIFWGNNNTASDGVGISFALDDRSSSGKSRQLTLTIYTGTSGQYVVSFTSADNQYPNDTRTHLIGVTYNQALANTNAIIYVDGVSVATGNKTAVTPNTANASAALTMGSGSEGSYGMVGRMSMPIILNRAKTPSQMLRDATRLLTLVRP